MSFDAKEKKTLRQDQPVHPSLHFELSSSQAVCHFTGDWNISAGGDLESVNQTWHSFFEQDLAVKQIRLKVHSQLNWDSRLVAFISAKKKVLLKNGIEVDGDFPEKLNQLIDLRSDHVESTKDSSVSPVSESFLDWWEPFLPLVIKPVQLFGSLDHFALDASFAENPNADPGFDHGMPPMWGSGPAYRYLDQFSNWFNHGFCRQCAIRKI